jgi:hypothetical protein
MRRGTESLKFILSDNLGSKNLVVNNEGFDRIYAGFSPISHIALGSSQITTFQNFWDTWVNSGQDQFLSGLTLWWNTINYVNIRQVFIPFISR